MTAAPEDCWRGRGVVVLGAGRSGNAAARLLTHLGAQVTLTDSREAHDLHHLEALPSQVRLQLGSHPDSLWSGADAIVTSPGVPATAEPLWAARAAGLEHLSEIELAAPLLAAPSVAITGSNGKSTVTTMVGDMLRRAGLRTVVCGNIGLPLSQVALEELQERRLQRCVIELSSFQTESITTFHATWNAILNLSADHLDRHGTMDAYTAAKLQLLRNCSAQDWVVYGADDEHLARSLATLPPRCVPFGWHAASETGPACWIEAERLYWRDPAATITEVIGTDELPLIGAHNILNTAAAIAIACLAGAEPTDAAATAREFSGLDHRMQSCGSVDGVVCIDDSKATNIGATAASLAGLGRTVCLILGGRDKGADFTLLRPLLRGRVRKVLLIGEASGKIAAALHGAVPLLSCGDLATAVSQGLAAARPGDALLLAPACTSFDQYEDFEARGDHFKSLIDTHVQGVSSHRAG